jgi:hypothetical protein
MTWASTLGPLLGFAAIILAAFLGAAACIWAENQKPKDPPEKKP